jgi:hypothetical protein
MIIKLTSSCPAGDRYFRVLSAVPVFDSTGAFTRGRAWERVNGGYVGVIELDGFAYIGLGGSVRAAGIDALQRYVEWRAQLGHTGRTKNAIANDIEAGLSSYDEAAFTAIPLEQIE